MPETNEVKVAEAPEKATHRTAIEDSIIESTVAAAVEPTPEVESTEEPEVSTEEEETKPELPVVEEVKEEIDEVEEILKEPTTDDDKSKVQRRIDSLTAQLKTLQEENARIKIQQDVKDGKKPKYTSEQLGTALMKAVEDGDKNLAAEVIKYMREDLKDEVVEMYQNEQKRMAEQHQSIQSEWDDVTNGYDKYRDSKNELYAGSSADLNIRDASSLLYQVAMKLYASDDPEMRKLYQRPGGQAKAVADALTLILQKKGGSKAKDIEKERLKKQLLKEKRKKSVVGGGVGVEKETTKSLTPSDVLSEVIADRKKYKTERI